MADNAACKHESCSFDRSICACGSMHDYCDECGAAMDCPLDKEPQEQSAVSAAIRYDVREYDAQREGMAIVSGWKVLATVTATNGRSFVPVPIAVCPHKDDAEEIAALLAEGGKLHAS